MLKSAFQCKMVARNKISPGISALCFCLFALNLDCQYFEFLWRRFAHGFLWNFTTTNVMEDPYQFAFFQFNATIYSFLFRSWNSKGPDVLWMCLLCLCLVISLDALKLLQEYLSIRMKLDPELLGTTVGTGADRSPLLRALMIPPSEGHVNSYRTKLHLAKTGATMLQIFCGMILMLALMTYNAYLFVTVIIGSGLSFAVMTIFKNVMKVKMAEGNLTRQQLSEFIGQSVNASGHHSASTRFNGANRY